jgi:uncharacterized protein GlcG (DUF336 family)
VALDNGGLFHPNRMWSAVVDRSGKVCSGISSDPDAWPNSRAIALAKANTANGLSNNLLAVSTANWYSAVQPGGSGQPGGPLFGLNNSNPFNPAFLTPATPDPALGQYVGGMITFGGGVALYNSVGKIIGGLGVSGDTSCADHVIAYRMRRLSGAAKIPSGVGFNKTDNIDYLAEGEAPNGFKRQRDHVCALDGCQWRAIPKDLPPRSTVLAYLDLWIYDGTLDRNALYEACRESRPRGQPYRLHYRQSEREKRRKRVYDRGR